CCLLRPSQPRPRPPAGHQSRDERAPIRGTERERGRSSPPRFLGCEGVVVRRLLVRRGVEERVARYAWVALANRSLLLQAPRRGFCANSPTCKALLTRPDCHLGPVEELRHRFSMRCVIPGDPAVQRAGRPTHVDGASRSLSQRLTAVPGRGFRL